jgi:hypothetical protein
MKTTLYSLTLATALAGVGNLPVTAQSEDQVRAREQVAKQQAEVARAQAEIAKAQAEASRNVEAIAVQRELLERDRESAVKAREVASIAAGKAQKEVQKAVEKARAASQKALADVDLSRVEVEVERAIAAAEAARQNGFFAQAAVPVPPAPPASPKSPTRMGGSVFGSSRRPSVRTLVVGAKSTDAKSIANLEEDLTVMWRILDKETEREMGKDGDKAMGIFISSSDSRSPVATYLDGYGALFTLSVRFPLVAPPKPKEEPKGETAPDSTWEKTRRELFGSPDFGGKEPKLKYYRGDNSAEAEYDAAKVEALKNGLLEALKNASNLRQLKPEDFVTVAVLGGGSSGGHDMFVYKSETAGGRTSYSVTSTSASATAVASSPDAFTAPAKEVMFGKIESARSSTLTIRVKKADVDAFANGKMSLDDFRQKAAINIH